MKKWNNRFVKAATYGILTAGAAFILLPFVWMILTSVKPGNEVLLMPPRWLPSKIQWENYVKAFQAVPFMTYFKNSVIVTVCITSCELITTVLAAFAFARLEFKGKNLLFMLLVATMMVPGEILVIPNFVTLAKLGWINSYKALIAPWAASVFSIFLLRQQFASIPESYYKAARMDGCGDLRYLLTVMVPMSRPTLVSVALLKVINSWNSYLWPLIATNEKTMRTLPVGLAYFSTEAGVQYNTLMAFSLLIISPTLIVYALTQKYIIQGVSKNGLKG
ncbi:MAG: carbohydrate ABC transporter permease [Lachnospiraceae bacterium]|jgi:multiple sugar transport system permease protein|nr:carbohydrate ABC transporter permease [Lachnospiraceae bacterium]